MAHGLNESQKSNRRGYDYWGKRPGNASQCNCPVKHKKTKIITHRKERAAKKEILYKEVMFCEK